MIFDDGRTIEKEKLKLQIDKILLSARVAGIRAFYFPQKGWAAVNLVYPLPEEFDPTGIRVTHQRLLGAFHFHCEDTDLSKIRIPGFNCEYNQYRRSQPRNQTMTDSNGWTIAVVLGYPSFVILPPPEGVEFP